MLLSAEVSDVLAKQTIFEKEQIDPSLEWLRLQTFPVGKAVYYKGMDGFAFGYLGNNQGTNMQCTILPLVGTSITMNKLNVFDARLVQITADLYKTIKEFNQFTPEIYDIVLSKFPELEKDSFAITQFLLQGHYEDQELYDSLRTLPDFSFKTKALGSQEKEILLGSLCMQGESPKTDHTSKIKEWIEKTYSKNVGAAVFDMVNFLAEKFQDDKYGSFSDFDSFKKVFYEKFPVQQYSNTEPFFQTGNQWIGEVGAGSKCYVSEIIQHPTLGFCYKVPTTGETYFNADIIIPEWCLVYAQKYFVEKRDFIQGDELTFITGTDEVISNDNRVAFSFVKYVHPISRQLCVVRTVDGKEFTVPTEYFQKFPKNYEYKIFSESRSTDGMEIFRVCSLIIEDNWEDVVICGILNLEETPMIFAFNGLKTHIIKDASRFVPYGLYMNKIGGVVSIPLAEKEKGVIVDHLIKDSVHWYAVYTDTFGDSENKQVLWYPQFVLHQYNFEAEGLTQRLAKIEPKIAKIEPVKKAETKTYPVPAISRKHRMFEENLTTKIQMASAGVGFIILFALL